jgi:hypothetical protein
MVTEIDIGVSALCAWRENRGGGSPGMQSILNVLVNRSKKSNTTPYEEAIRKEQFSSITTPGNPELILFPAPGDTQMTVALAFARQAFQSDLTDITQGAIYYYAPSGIGPSSKTFTLPGGTIVPFPQGWNESVVQFTVEIAGQLFFKDAV